MARCLKVNINFGTVISNVVHHRSCEENPWMLFSPVTDIPTKTVPRPLVSRVSVFHIQVFLVSLIVIRTVKLL